MTDLLLELQRAIERERQRRKADAVRDNTTPPDAPVGEES